MMDMLMIKRLFAVLLLLPGLAQAQTLEERFRAQAQGKERERFLTLSVENDSIGGGTDRHYTSGVRATWFDTASTPPGIADFIDTYVPVFSINDTTSVYYTLGQNLYTPRDIRTVTPDPADRPYAAFLYGSAGLATLKGNRIDYLELTAGLVGPWALGKQAQTLIHEPIGSPKPKGWHDQLHNEPGLMASWQRLWPEAAAMEIGPLRLRGMPYVGATLGNVYTYGSTGLIFQLVPGEHPWQGLPPRIKPAMPGSGYFSVPEGEFAWSLFAGLEGRAVGRNIFLDGNTFRDSPSVDKKYFVGDANAGLALAYGRIQMTYTINFRTEEFEGQRRPDYFGAVGLGYRF